MSSMLNGNSAGNVFAHFLFYIGCYVLSICLIYGIWDPSGFFGFLGALIIALPVSWIVRFVLVIPWAYICIYFKDRRDGKEYEAHIESVRRTNEMLADFEAASTEFKKRKALLDERKAALGIKSRKDEDTF